MFDGQYSTGKGGGAPTPFVNAFQGHKLNSLRYNTSQAGSPVALAYGTVRLSINLIEGFGFHGSGSSGKGGKGLGPSAGKKGGQQSYSVNVAFALCQGPISFTGASHGIGGNNRIWANGGVNAGLSHVGLNGYAGTDGQAPDPVFLSSSPDTPVLGYSGTGYVTGTPMQLGSSPALPSIQFEVTAFEAGTAGPDYPDDARPDLIITDMLTNIRYGAGFPSANLDTTAIADFGTYCQASRLVMSIAMDRQQPCARWVEEICELTISAPVWSGSKLKIIPYADQSFSGNGTSWTPALTAQYSLTDDDFIDFGGGSDPVLLTRTDPAQATNWLSVEYMDAFNGFNPSILPVFDQGLIDLYGLRTEASIQAHEYTNSASAGVAATLMLFRKSYLRNSPIKFKLGFRFSRLEPMDIVTLTDATLGLTDFPVRVIQIDEDDNGELTITAEEMPGTPFIAPVIQDTFGDPVDFLADPGDINDPVIFEPPPGLTGGAREAWVIATGADPNWGGCQVWISTDGSTYGLAGTLYRGGRQGELTATLASHADPDTVDTLSVDVTMSEAQLLSGTQSDADLLVTLCYCGGELVSFETATLTAAFEYDLTYLRRGAYGTTISAHASGEKFARFNPNDASLFKYAYPAPMVGQIVYGKFPSFNIFGQSLQDISTVPAYGFLLSGTGSPSPTFEASGSQTGPTTANLVIARFVFCSTVLFPGLFAGSWARAVVPATNSTTYTIRKNGALPVGTMVFGPGGTVASFTSTGANTAFNWGDFFEIVAPASPDPTLANIAWNLAGQQGGSTPVVEAHGSQSGRPTASLVILRWVADNPVIFDLAGVGVGLSDAVATSASLPFAVEKNGSPFCSMAFAAGSSIATFTGSATNFVPGDVLTVVAPPVPDATLANIKMALPAANLLTNPNGYISGSISGAMPASLVIFSYVFTSTMVFPVGMPGSVAVAGVAASGSPSFSIQNNGIPIATMDFAPLGIYPTFTGGGTTFNAGDRLTIVAPASPDATLGDLAWALAGTR